MKPAYLPIATIAVMAWAMIVYALLFEALGPGWPTRPGRTLPMTADLNRRLAEALGWTVESDPSGRRDVYTRHGCAPYPPGEPRWRNLVELSTTWEGAGLICEAMRERGWLVSVEQFKEVGESHLDDAAWRHLWLARFRRGTDSHALEADTAPEAVALAALKALEGD